MLIPINAILPNPEQPRKEFDMGEMQALTESILEHGLINPIAVEESGDDQYILIDGERRWRACKMAGLKTIEASVRASMDGAGSRERIVLALVGNLHRSDLNVMEQAQSYKRLHKLGLSVKEISAQVGMTESNIYLRFRLLEMEPEIQELFAAGKLPIHSQIPPVIMELPAEKRVRIMRSLAAKNASIKTILMVCKRVANGQSNYRSPVRDHNERWNMLKQIGSPVPEQYQAAAIATCKNCAIYDDASPKTCRDCPAVELLQKLIKK
jgi:ParB family transcriptional regulator, chromosome partitioning protein